MNLINRAGPDCVALETTLPVHGVPEGAGRALARQLHEVVKAEGARAAFTGVHAGHAVVGLSDEELADLLKTPGAVPKANAANLGVILHRGGHGATTVSTTMELAAKAGVRVAATGGLGGVHRHLGDRLDISADLGAFTRFPIAVVTSGVKSLLDVVGTREALETLGVPVVGFGTDSFPAFYLRESKAGLDARFDDSDDLAAFVAAELDRTGRGVVVAQPVPAAEAVDPEDWERWMEAAERRAAAEGVRGREVTPAVLAALHEVSGGATLRANIALAVANARLAARLCRRLLAR